MSDADLTSAPSAVATDDSDRFKLLDLDGGPSTAPVLPAWATAVLNAIRAIVVGVTLESAEAAYNALALAIAPARSYPEGPGKVAVRAAMEAKQGEIRALRASLRTAPAAAAAPPPPTERQAIPTVTTTAPSTAVDHQAQWARLPNGEWGARIDTRGQLRPPVAGDSVIVHNAKRTTSSRRYFCETAANGVAVVSKDPPTPAYVANPANATPASEPAPSVEPVLAEGTAPASVSLESTLAATASPIVAADPSAPRAYVQPTERVADNAAFQRNATTSTPAGRSYADSTPAERRELMRVGSRNETRADVKRLLDEKALIAGAVAEGSMLQVSWVGGGKTTLGKVREALAAIGREHDAPGAPSSVRHAGRAVDALRSSDYDTDRMPGKDLPDGIKACWVVWRKATAASLRAGDPVGSATLVVNLSDSDTLSFSGDQTLAARVLGVYNAATTNEELKSEDLTSWLGSMLRNKHYAVKRGAVWYVPGGQADRARALCETISKLWGDHERIPVTTGPDLMRSLTRGLSDEAGKIAADFVKATDDAKERAREKCVAECKERNTRAARRNGAIMSDATIAAEADAAAKRANISATIAARLMRDLATVAARIEGYALVLGDESTKSVKALVIELRNKIEPLCSDFDQRAAMLEFT